MSNEYQGGYTRRQELTCTEAQIATYADLVLHENEKIYVRMNNGVIRMKLGDGVTNLRDLPYTKIYDGTLEDVEAMLNTRLMDISGVLVSPEEPTNPDVSVWIDPDEGEGENFLTEADIAQGLGDRPDMVLSQKAVTREFGEVKETLVTKTANLTLLASGTLGDTATTVEFSTALSGANLFYIDVSAVSSGNKTFAFSNGTNNTYVRIVDNYDKYFWLNGDFTSVTANAKYNLYLVNNPQNLYGERIKTLGDCLYVSGNVNIGDMLQGNNVLEDGKWTANGGITRICTEIFKRAYCKVTASCDFDSGYQIGIQGFKGDKKIYDTNWVTTETTVAFTDCDGFAVAVRRYVNDVDEAITPDMATGLVITEESYIIPADKTEFEQLKKHHNALQTEHNALQTEHNATSQIAKRAFNPFRHNKYYGHLFIDKVNADDDIVFPCQSQFDIDATARLGFSVIEGNVQKTATEGKYVVMHGTSGYLGEQVVGVNDTIADPATVKFANISFDDLRANYVYRSKYAKYQTPIISLEEFLYACKKRGLIPFVQYVDDAMVAITKNIIGNDFILYGATRDKFDGMIYKYGSSSATKDDIISICEEYGAPLMYGLHPNHTFTDDELKEIIAEVHSRDCLIGWCGCYISLTQDNRMNNLGLDFSSAGWNVNDFDSGNIVNAKGDIDFSEFTHTGTVSTGVLTLADGDTVTIDELTSEFLAKGFLNIKFNGALYLSMGYKHRAERVFTSNGETTTQFSTYFLEEIPTFTITSSGTTEIMMMDYKASKC